MNYIKLIRHYWMVKRDRADFDSYVTTLYFALVEQSNINNWKPFSVYRDNITDFAGMSPTAYYKARAILKDAGLISFEEGSSKLTKCVFTVLEVYLLNTVQEHDKDSTKTVQRHKKNSTKTILDKPINNKTYKHNKLINKDTDSNEPEPPKENYQRLFLEAYIEFYESRVSVKPKITNVDAIQGAALRKYLINVSSDKTETGALNSLKYIFQNWDKIEPFLQNQLSLTQINKNINNILNQVKNGTIKPITNGYTNRGAKPDIAGLSDIAAWHVNGGN